MSTISHGNLVNVKLVSISIRLGLPLGRRIRIVPSLSKAKTSSELAHAAGKTYWELVLAAPATSLADPLGRDEAARCADARALQRAAPHGATPVLAGAR